MERALAATSNSVLRQSSGGRESDSKRERETCLHRRILNLPKKQAAARDSEQYGSVLAGELFHRL